MRNKTVDMSMLNGAGSSVRLIEREAEVESAATKNKLLTSLPVIFEQRHKALKAAGVTSLLLNQYIIDALREKLERDEQRN